jgi:hypothetical protein
MNPRRKVLIIITKSKADALVGSPTKASGLGEI